MLHLLKYVLHDLLRTRFVLLYAAFLFFSTAGMFQLEADPGKVALSLMNILLIVTPLVSVVFTTIHFYNSYEFIELMLSQPLDRRRVFLAEYFAVALALCAAFLAGVGLPMLGFGVIASGLALLCSGVALTLAFVSLAFLAASFTRDKAKAIGVALLFWLYFSLIYDAIVLWVLYAFADYPLEKTTLVLVCLNPVDLARILVVLQLDISALMGYTGAFFRNFFGGSRGLAFTGAILLVWIIAPLWLSMRIFKRKDL